MSGAFSAGAAVHVDGEDPNMLRYVEEALAKRRAGDATVRDDAEPATRPGARDGFLWDVPANLAATRREDDESAARHMTGIVEVQLPMDCKMRNIEETERAKRAILERERGDEETPPRGAPATGGRPEASRTTAFDSTGRCSRRRSGRVAVRGETRRHARGGGREMTNGETTNGGAGGGGGGRGAAARWRPTTSCSSGG